MSNQKQQPTYEILKDLGEISRCDKTGWSRRVRIVSWNNATPKFDIRDWSDNPLRKPSKGQTYTKEQLINLVDFLNNNKEWEGAIDEEIQRYVGSGTN